MDKQVGSYFDEWAEVVKDPIRQKQFRQYVNSDKRELGAERIDERGQQRFADWPKDFPGVILSEKDVATPKSTWQWRKMCAVDDLVITDKGPTSVAVRYGETPLAIFHVPQRGYYATQQMCPHKRAFVLDHGIVGENKDGDLCASAPVEPI